MEKIFSYEIYDGHLGGLKSYKLYNDVKQLAKDLDNNNPFIIQVYNKELVKLGDFDNYDYEWIKDLETFSENFRYEEYIDYNFGVKKFMESVKRMNG